jgi:8-oxo-dGTP pyrophosphatase MutT (NUDIX family)
MGGKKRNDSKNVMSLDDAMADLASRFVVNCPTEEQESINRCMWQVEAAHWFYDDVVRRHQHGLPFLNFKDFTMAFLKACPSLNLDDESISRALNLFAKYKRRVPVCGAIMLNAAMTKCVLVKAWGKCSAWSFPKGKINQDESKFECALREVEEETGYDCREQANHDQHIELLVRQQQMRLYIAPGVPEDVVFKTQTRKEIGDIRWVRLDRLGDGNNNDFLDGAVKQGVDAPFFTGAAFLGSLRDWIVQHQGQTQPSEKNSTKKNRSRSNSNKKMDNSNSDSDGAKNSSRKKKLPKSAATETFGFNQTGGWSVEEMFAVNEQKFGITNSYDESLYTTKLPAEYLQQRGNANSSRRSGQKGQKARSRSASVPAVEQALPPPPVVERSSSDPSASPSASPYLAPSNTTTPVSTFAPCINTFLTPTRSDMPQTCAASITMTSAPSSTPLLDFSFNRDEILSCF